ncbi:MAG: hemerythrin domain-containing protein [Magnetovibrio sp.]|nr:hemerythrin domain-containing protein [Magnetovibrio sp.]
MQTQDNKKPLDILGVLMEHIPDNVLLEPIEYIFADHCRQRDLCNALQELAVRSASTVIGPQPAQVILSCLKHDLPLHIEDEEKDLFPLLLKRAEPQDKIEDIIRLLGSEHQRDRELVNEVTIGLKEIAAGQPLSEPSAFRTAAEVLASSHMSHMNWENAVVLELARRRLGADDQQAMAQNMAARRGIKLPID